MAATQLICTYATDINITATGTRWLHEELYSNMFHLSDLFQDLGLGGVGEIVPILVQSSVQRVPFHFTAFKREESQADHLWGCQQRQTFDCVACYRNSKVGGLGGLGSRATVRYTNTFAYTTYLYPNSENQDFYSHMQVQVYHDRPATVKLQIVTRVTTTKIPTSKLGLEAMTTSSSGNSAI